MNSCSIALKIPLQNADLGPIELPNHPSSEIFIIKLVPFSDD